MFKMVDIECLKFELFMCEISSKLKVLRNLKNLKSIVVSHGDNGE